jgi:DNA-binding NtrC family response regulator
MKPRSDGIVMLDRNEEHSQAIQEGLTLAGFSVTVCKDIEECRRFLAARRFDAFLVDVLMTRTGDTDLIEWARRISPGLRVVVLGDFDSPFLEKQVTAKGAERFVIRPVDLEWLTEILASEHSQSRQSDLLPEDPNHLPSKTNSRIHRNVCNDSNR